MGEEGGKELIVVNPAEVVGRRLYAKKTELPLSQELCREGPLVG